jgi:hypothetical protein
MALRGEIPKAAKLGRRWTFDIKALRAWIASKERETAPQRGTRMPTAAGERLFIESPLQRAIRRKLDEAEKDSWR